jgi:Beta protein
MYSPILRNRQNEMLAIKDLKNDVCEHIMPLFDLAAPTKAADRKKDVPYVEKNIARTQNIVRRIPSVMIDSSELDAKFRVSDNVHPLVAAAAAIRDGGSVPIPVTGLHRDFDHGNAVKKIFSNGAVNGLCLRLDATDVSTVAMTHRNIHKLLENFSVATEETILLLDMQCLYGHQIDQVATQITKLLSSLSVNQWRAIQVGGYGIPDQISTAVQTNAQGYLPRIEQDIFYTIAKRDFESPLWFADYTTLSPAVVELDWRLISKVMTPRALYTLGSSWFVVRGGAISSHPDGNDQYFQLAEEVVALDEFCGSDFSEGDDYILKRSRHSGKAGNAGSWIRACVNHHIAFTATMHSI